MAILDNNPLHFTCSRCGAKPYTACKDTKSRVIKPHKERVRLYSRRAPEPITEAPPVIPDNVTESPNHKPDITDEADIGG